MGLIIGPTNWWVNELIALCPVATTLPDGSKIFCKAGGTAWIVAPSQTQVNSFWTDCKCWGVDSPGTEVCCICDWSTLCNRLISCGFNPSNWFVPNGSQMQSAYVCRSNWDFCSCTYWTATETSTTTLCACFAAFYMCPDGSLCSCFGGACFCTKNCSLTTRAIRCVTY